MEQLKGENILFIGGAGFIGSNLIQKFLQKATHKIFVLEPPLANLSRIESVGNKITIIRGYLSDLDFIQSLIFNNEINRVVHLVSNLIPGSSYVDYLKEFEHVIFPTLSLMGLCAESGVKFAFFSSGGTVYGNNMGEKFKESDRLAPISYYGLSKQVIEDAILFEHRTKSLDFLIIRPSNPFGPGQSLFANQGLIAVAIGKILSKQPIVIWGNGGSVRDYIYSEDLAESFLQVIEKGISNEIINMGSGLGYSVNEIITILKRISSENIEIKYEGDRSVDVNRMVLDISKLESLVTIKPTTIEDGINVFFQFVKESLNTSAE
ncbi:MAG TPA: NAD-dependent epimerase/dehydratase family protein [Phnomibacter sp.]|nr:NAD-dependent epimerase/dehydratase family protein [Phnomibacter sp.]